MNDAADAGATWQLPIPRPFTPRCDVNLHIERDDGTASDIQTRCRIDTMTYFCAGGIPVFVTRKIIEGAGNDNKAGQRQTVGG